MSAPAAEAEANPHAPATTGWLRRLLGPFYFTGVFWYRFPLLGARVLPDPLVGIFVWLFATFFFLTLGKLRRAVGRNQELVRGPLGMVGRWKAAHRTILEFSWCLGERYEQFAPRKEFESIREGVETWEAANAEGQGYILITAHLGNWEVGSTLPSTKEQLVVHLVREQEMDPKAQEFIRGLLDGLGGVTYHTHFATGDFDLGLDLLHALKRGEKVALQADRPRTGGASATVEMFGTPYEMPVGPVVLARLANVPLLPIFVLRAGRRRYRLVFRDLIRVPRTRDRAADHRQALEQIVANIEWAVREDPKQWFCFRDLRA